MSPYLTVAEVADRYRTTPRAVHGWTSKRAIPMLKRAGARRVLFKRDDLDAWDAGATLEAVDLPGGGVLVRPVESGRGRRAA